MSRKSFEYFMFSLKGHDLHSKINCAEMSANRFGWEIWQACEASVDDDIEAQRAKFQNAFSTPSRAFFYDRNPDGTYKNEDVEVCWRYWMLVAPKHGYNDMVSAYHMWKFRDGFTYNMDPKDRKKHIEEHFPDVHRGQIYEC